MVSPDRSGPDPRRPSCLCGLTHQDPGGYAFSLKPPAVWSATNLGSLAVPADGAGSEKASALWTAEGSDVPYDSGRGLSPPSLPLMAAWDGSVGGKNWRLLSSDVP